ncbi:hypothetical protein C0993_007127 [Termitomyces sp. T159_Od127]|nr:hypothetical protein C0993_007127 [Termitomyces sp. T159_Od127]
MLTDDRCFKVRVNGIWTGRDGHGYVNTPDDLLEEIRRFNPIMTKVNLMGKSRWMHAETDLRQKKYSLVVLEFAKEEDAKTLLATRYIAMYTKFCEVVHHADQPPVLQCSWLCVGAHNETDHKTNVIEAEEGGMDEGGQIDNEDMPKCANCGGDHPAMERNCPERKRYQMLTREKDNGTVVGGVQVRKKRGVKKLATTGQGQGNTRGMESQRGREQAEKANAREIDDQVEGEDRGEQTTQTRNKTNKFMALKNLLNQQDELSWADIEIEEQCETEPRNHEAIELDATEEWTVDPSLAYGSDHFALRWTINHGATEIQDPTGSRYNLKETKPDNWKDVFENKMSKQTERWEILCRLDTDRSPEDLDKDVELIMEAMEHTTAETAKEKKLSNKARPWWSNKLSEANNRRMALREDQRAFEE